MEEKKGGSVKSFFLESYKKAEKSVKKTVASLTKPEKEKAATGTTATTTATTGAVAATTPPAIAPPPSATTIPVSSGPPPIPTATYPTAPPRVLPPQETAIGMDERMRLLQQQHDAEFRTKMAALESEYQTKQLEMKRHADAESIRLQQEQAAIAHDRQRMAALALEREQFNKERQSHAESMAALRRQYETLSSNYASLQRASSALQTDLELERVRSRSLQEQLSRAATAAPFSAATSEELAQMSRKYSELETRYQSEHAMYESLKSGRSELEKLLVARDTLISKLESDITGLKEQLRSENMRALHIENEHNAAADQLKVLKAEHAKTLEQLRSVKSERESGAAADVQALYSKISQLEAEVSRLDNARATEVGELQQRLTEQDRQHWARIMENERGYQKHIANITEISKAKDTKIHEMQSKMDQLNSQVRALEQSNANINMLQSKLKSAEERETEMRAQLSDLQNARSRLAARDAEVADLGTKLAEAENDIASLRARITEMESSATTQAQPDLELQSKFTSLQQENESLRHELSIAQTRLSELSGLPSAIQERDATISELQARVSSFHQQEQHIKELESKLHKFPKMEARVAKYKARKSDWKKSAGQIKDLNQRVAELQAQVREAQSHTDSEHARFSQLQADYTKLRDTHVMSSADKESLEEKIRILEAQQRDNAAMHQEELKKFGEQVANAKSENREMMIRLQERDTTIDTLKHELEEARARIQQLEQDLSTAQAQQRAADEAVRSRIDGAEARVKELEGTIEQLYRERDDAQSRLSQLQSERDLWQEQRSQHERKISESVERQQQMALEIKSLRDELTRFVTVSPAVEGGEEQGMQERPTSPPVPSKFAFEQSLRGSAK